MSKVIKYVIMVVIVLSFVAGITAFLYFRNPTEPPMPSPNGYYQFIHAAQMVGRPFSNEYDYGNMSKERLELLLATNQAALQLVHLGLRFESRVPPEYVQDNTIRGSILVGNLRVLAQLICAEGRLDGLDGKTNEAVRSYLDAICFGQKCSHGGTGAAKYAGFFCEKEGLTNLQAMFGSLNAPECKEIVAALETAEAQDEPAGAYWRRSLRSLPKRNNWRDALDPIIHYREIHEAIEDFRADFAASALRRRQALINFASRAYELEKGKRPQNATDLVPEYLKAAPKDPVTGKELGLGQ